MFSPIVTKLVHPFSGSLKSQTDTLAEETPVALVYNGVSHVVLMATPQNLPELALGFSLSERILTQTSQLYDLTIEESCHGISVHMEIASERFVALKERRRNLSGRTGCGLCGIDSLTAVLPEIEVIERKQKIHAQHIQTALEQLREHQPLREQTGSLHGAAWVVEGKIQVAFEDIGRHNALDKLLGFLAKHQMNQHNGFVLVSSRASYEMVAKVAVLGVGVLVAVSAATALAVRMAEQAQLTLIGFTKPQQFTAYTHEQFIELDCVENQ